MSETTATDSYQGVGEPPTESSENREGEKERQENGKMGHETGLTE